MVTGALTNAVLPIFGDGRIMLLAVELDRTR
jgi:hypothetical protein